MLGSKSEHNEIWLSNPGGIRRGIGPDDVAEYYDSQPLGMSASYRIVEHRRLADDLILGYAAVDFSFTDRPTLPLYLSVILRQVGDSWLIAHYQVSRLPEA